MFRGRERMDKAEFLSPGKEYRPSPFWSWNNLLDTEELKRQVREFAEKGFGGYFMHARVGLATLYLSEEWMNCVKACLEEGKKVDLESWLYDEDKWPSGFAGGFVPSKGDEYRARSIVYEEITPGEMERFSKDKSVLGIFEIKFSSSKRMLSFRKVDTPETAIQKNSKIVAFRVKIADKSNWFNGESYVDLLNPKVTEEFLKVTHDAYASRFKDDFGEYMPGIFTDEPNYVGGDLIPWTDEMRKYFYRLNGYDITEKLPLLYFDGEGSEKVRYDFWRTVTLRFIEAFTKPYSKRCESLGLKMTGHYLSEDTLVSQIRVIGAAMPHYEYMQCPGIDHLGRNIENPLTLKQCSSVAHQFGRRRVLSELFGCSGHSMSFEDQKWIADFHFALGITFLCPHLTLYTMRGDAKRDYPPTFSYHQPYWPYFKLINDYFARASYVCSQGRYYADILLLHPISSAWTTYSPLNGKDPDSPPNRYNDLFVSLLEDLLALHWDFDLGDEIIIGRHAGVEDRSVRIGEMKYKVLIVPPSLNWSRKTYELMWDLVKSGGKVIFVGETPRLIDGEPSEKEWNSLLSDKRTETIRLEKEALQDALRKVLTKQVSVLNDEDEEVGDIIVNHRVDGPLHIYFLANKSREHTYNVKVVLPVTGEVEEWNLFSGRINTVETSGGDKETIIRTVFPPAGSRVFVVDTSRKATRKKALKEMSIKHVVKLPETWRFERLHPNTLVLDRCRYSLDGREWSEIKPVWKIRREVWEEAGLKEYTGIQPWVLRLKNVKPKKEITLHLKVEFKSEIVGEKIFLVIERPELWKLKVNGRPVSTSTAEWHWDLQFGKIDISKHVAVGRNEIVLSCQYNIDTPIEDMYLVGDFGVKKISETEYVLTNEPETLRNGDWTEQGYPFYCGTMRYNGRFYLEDCANKVLIRLPEARGCLFIVKVNGGKPIPICWRPLQADITDFVKKGENTVTIDVVSTLRNAFGPLHHVKGDLTSVGPGSFMDEKNWTDSYQLVPYGLIDGAEIVVSEEKFKD
ncbi:MAG TPA: hypothetical protein ENF42_02095 [Candidatus Bathyarchaeota archaeon]|nr:hypothetical protein [Candidatus Bathyarchaeota archaeon]